MCTYLTSWPVLAAASVVSIGLEALKFVTTAKAENLAVNGGTFCSNSTLQYMNQDYCDSSFTRFNNWDDGAKAAMIGAPICLALTIGAIYSRCVKRSKQSAEDGETQHLIVETPAARRSFCIKVADVLSSSVAKALYGGVAITSFIFTLPGQYFLNPLAFQFGETLCVSCAAKTKYLVLKSFINAAFTACPLSMAAFGAACAYSDSKKRKNEGVETSTTLAS